MNATNGIPMVIGYRVGIDPTKVKGNTQGELFESLSPLTLADHSPFIARMLAISFVQAHPFVYLGCGLHRLAVYLTDYISGREYLIFNGRKPTKKMLENLETEFLIYVRNGYQYNGWQLMTDTRGNAYRAISTDYWLMTDDHLSKCR